jgi:ABC-type phosphate transport system substrate-binding protein
MGYSQIPAAANNGVQLRYTLTSSGTLTIAGASTSNPITATVVCVGGGAGGGGAIGGRDGGGGGGVSSIASKSTFLMGL